MFSNDATHYSTPTSILNLLLEAENGLESYECSKKYAQGVIICDLMTVKNGGELFLQLAKANDQLKNISLIFFLSVDVHKK